MTSSRQRPVHQAAVNGITGTRRRTIGDHLAVLGGADLKVLDHVASERGGFVSLGLVMLSTAGVAAVSMFFAIRNAVLVDIDTTTGMPYPHQPLGVTCAAVILGLLWGALILILDRALVKGMQGVHGRRVWGYFAPRFGLALIIGVVVSTPITLRIFQNEILSQVHAQQNTAIDEQNKQASTGDTATAVTRKQQAVDAQEKIVTSGGDVPNTPEVKQAQAKVDSLTADVAAASEKVDEKRLAMICEKEGLGSARGECTGIASDRAGEGDLYAAAKDAYDSAVNDLETKQGELDQAKLELTKAQDTAVTAAGTVVAAQKEQARRLLCGKETNPQTIDNSPCHYDTSGGSQPTGLRAELANLQAQQNGMLDPDAIRKDAGLLSQLNALMALSSHNAGAAWAHWMVAALFILIELLPVVVKTMTAFRGESQYDRVLKKVQDDELDDASQDFDGRSIDRELDAQHREAIANDMLARRIHMGKMANKVVADEMVGVVTVVLEEWKQGVQDEMRRRAKQAATSPPSQSSSASGRRPASSPVQGGPFNLPPKGTP